MKIIVKNSSEIYNIIPQIQEALNNTVYENLELSIEFKKNFVYPEVLTSLVAFINWCNNTYNNFIINNIDYDISNLYLHRMKFFKLIPYNEKEPVYQKHDSMGKFIEITPLNFDKNNKVTIQSNIVDNIIKIFRDNYKLKEELYRCLNYCIWELIDNIQNHSGECGTGYISAQNFPNKKEIRICIVDTGMGIYNSLTSSPNSLYQDITEEEAMIKCVEANVTNGSGMGNGLYHTTQFIKANGGDLYLYSGNYCLEVSSGCNPVIRKSDKWNGTLVFLRIDTENTVDYDDVFDNCMIPASVDECDDELDGLWS